MWRQQSQCFLRRWCISKFVKGLFCSEWGLSFFCSVVSYSKMQAVMALFMGQKTWSAIKFTKQVCQRHKLPNSVSNNFSVIIMGCKPCVIHQILMSECACANQSKTKHLAWSIICPFGLATRPVDVWQATWVLTWLVIPWRRLKVLIMSQSTSSDSLPTSVQSCVYPILQMCVSNVKMQIVQGLGCAMSVTLPS